MNVLGLAAFHRDSAAALVVDGVPIAAEKQERFTKKPRDSSFPRAAARSVLERAGVRSRELDRVVFAEKPLVKFERLLATQLSAFPRSSRAFAETMYVWLGDRLWLKNRIASELEVAPERVFFCEHQRAHAASAFLPSPFDEAAILCVDDFGEWATTALAVGRGSEIEMLSELRFPHSLGLVASAITQFLGFEPGVDESKLEALAALGAPKFEREFAELVRATDAGGFEVDLRRFRFDFDGAQLFDESMAELFGAPRVSGGELRIAAPDSRDADLAASLQRTLESRVLALAHELARRTNAKRLCFAGQVAQNRALNARLLREGPFEELFVPADPDEAGAALGAALAIAHSTDPNLARSRGGDTRLGSPVDDVGHAGARVLGDDATNAIAEMLADSKLVAWIRGRMDFSVESLGARSIFAHAGRARARTDLLGAVRHSERYLPGRIAVRAERADEFFETPRGSADALRFGWIDVTPRDALRRAVPDLAARVAPMLVDREHDPQLHALLVRLEHLGVAPLLWHANFALRGSPCVRSESDALEAFERSALDLLIVEDRLYERAAAVRG